MPVAIAAAALAALVVAESATRRRVLVGPQAFVGGADKVTVDDPRAFVGPLVGSRSSGARGYAEDALKAACRFLGLPGCETAGGKLLDFAFAPSPTRAKLRAQDALNRALNGDPVRVQGAMTIRRSATDPGMPIEAIAIEFSNGCRPFKGCPEWKRCKSGTISMHGWLGYQPSHCP